MWWETAAGDYVNSQHVRALTVSLVTAGSDLSTAAITAHVSDAQSHQLEGDFGVAASTDAAGLEAIEAAARDAARKLCQGFDPNTI